MFNRSYARTLRVGKLMLGSLLTVSMVAGDRTWHASISVLKPNYKPKAADKMPPDDVEIIRAQLEEMLEGVGVKEKSEFFQAGSAFHLMRQLTDEEWAGMGQMAAAGDN